MKPHGVVEGGHHGDLGAGTGSAREPGAAVGQRHSVQEVVVRSIGDHTLMQSQGIAQLALTADPERLICPDLGVHQLLECMTLRILELQRHRLHRLSNTQ